AVAPDAAAMATVREKLPRLAADLLREEVAPLDVAAVISEVMRAMTGRAAELAQAEMAARGEGAPAPFCVLILGSGGRGESLLAPDQDNALIHAGTASDDAWFQEFGRRLNRLLDDAGVPYCKGGVMVARPLWRADVAGWRKRIDGWIAHPSPEHLLNVDIFFDFQPVHGDRRLAAALREEALTRASGAFDFLKLLSVQLDAYRAPLGLFGRFTAPGGRLDLKIGGLFPIVAGARTMALRYGVDKTATPMRLRALHDAGRLAAADLSSLTVAHQLLTGLLLKQQIADVEAGLKPSSGVELTRIDRRVGPVLKETLRRLEDVPAMVRNALAG
ncbi:MAG TPA: DUF294 nucleotidyltransferase-like domain-containing protein, partial [Alphaproteobacteria bacterium]|nr:DUF294 nucleotidyltransferase-like domain-containing protein [Alphaproteobacteria bacterium]